MNQLPDPDDRVLDALIHLADDAVARLGAFEPDLIDSVLWAELTTARLAVARLGAAAMAFKHRSLGSGWPARGGPVEKD